MIEYAPCGLVWVKPGAAFETVLTVPEVVQPAVVLCQAELPVEAGVVVESPLPAVVLAQVSPPLGRVAVAGRVAVFNAQTLATVEYARPWSMVAGPAGEVYGLTAEGMERLTGAIEAGAVPQVRTGRLWLAPGAAVTVPVAHLGLCAAQAVDLVAMAEVDGADVARAYAVPGRSGTVEHPRRVRLARAVRGAAWQFTLRAAGSWALGALAVAVERVRRAR